jgi:hypothetical protein
MGTSSFPVSRMNSSGLAYLQIDMFDFRELIPAMA